LIAVSLKGAVDVVVGVEVDAEFGLVAQDAVGVEVATLLQTFLEK